MSGFDDPRLPADLTLPLLLGLAAMVLFLLFQTYALLEQRSALGVAFDSQSQPISDANKVRRQLEALAGGTAQLASKGNLHAQQIVAELAKQGVSLTPPK